MSSVLLVLVHLTVAASWLGSMAYSLTVVQPKVDEFFPDEERREEFLVLLAHGNRWKVLGLIAVLLATGSAVAVTSDGLVMIGYAISLGLYTIAAGLFWYVTWRHWPARVFAIAEELAGFRRRLRIVAATMLLLVGVAFVTALGVSVAVR
jgi:Flp pilus assembly protein TadB